ncbi:MAG: hypothetical protein ABWZ08_14040 [Pseudoxanthomonas sp.]
MASTPKSEKILRKEGVILIIITATIYAAFLVREMGYADFFLIPHELIAASHIGLFSAAKAIAFGAAAYIGKVNLVWILAPRGEKPIIFYIRHAIGTSLIIGFALYPYMSVDVSWLWFVGIVCFLLFGWFVWPLITQKNVIGYENKVAEQAHLEATSKDIFSSLFEQVDRSTYITLCLVIAMMIFAYGDGRRGAIEQENFYIVEGNPNLALIRIYGDTAVFVEFDLKKKKLDGLVRMAKISEETGITIRQTAIGRLKRFEFKK